MFRNWLTVALRDLARSPVISFIAIGGLAIGLAAAILAGTVIANQLGYDHFIPGYERTYFGTVEYFFNENPPEYFSFTPHDLAAHIRQYIPEVEAVTRIDPGQHALRHGVVEAQEATYEADPNVFKLLPLPLLQGNLDHALDNPDSIVLPRSIALKYFGRDDVVGQTIEMDRQYPLKITAVVEDLPQNASNLGSAIFISGRSAYAALKSADGNPANGPVSGNFIIDSQTLVRLKPGVSVDRLQSRIQTMSSVLLPAPKTIKANMYLVGLDQFHLSKWTDRGARARLAVLSIVAFLILFLAVVNFINLSVGRSVRRGLEVGIRKAAGAGQGALMIQFLGEAVVQALLAVCIAGLLAELALPAINSFLDSGAVLDYAHQLFLVPALLLGAIATGIVAGAYPALIQSSFRPATVLGGLNRASDHAGLVRQFLVGLQFTILTVLVISAGVVFEQYRFATKEALQLQTDQMMFVRVPACDGKFSSAVAALPGVRGVACSGTSVLEQGGIHGNAKRRDGTVLSVRRVTVGTGMMDLYGLKPLAGRFLEQNRAGDVLPPKPAPDFPVRMVVNQTLVRGLGFASAEAAIGKVISVSPYRGPIIGVVKDYTLNASPTPIEPAMYFASKLDPDPPTLRPSVLLHIKLDKNAIVPTLAAIDAAWNKGAASGPIQRTFMNDYVEKVWLPLLREGQAFSAFAGVAVFLASLGLFGLSLSTAQRRTREIGIRKAAGASTAQIVLLLLWQFAKPVLWASLIAWPLAYWAMDRWLSGFARHIDMPFWLFPVAGAATIAVALLTVAGQTLIVARQKPVLALRYE